MTLVNIFRSIKRKFQPTVSEEVVRMGKYSKLGQIAKAVFYSLQDDALPTHLMFGWRQGYLP